jgi:2-octaprenyl-6-methoxyphenol hydroxylase
MEEELGERYDIIIVGGGFVGLITANILAQNNLRVALIEKNSLIENNLKHKNVDRRGIALNAKSVEFLAQYGLWQELIAFAGPIEEIRVVDNHSRLFLHFANDLINNKILGYIVDADKLLHTWLAAARSNDNITIYDNANIAEIATDSYNASVTMTSGAKITAKLIIGADGKNSAVRRKMGVKLHQYDYHQSALVFNVRHRESHGGIAVEHFMPSGPFAILPRYDMYSSSIVWTEKYEVAEQLMKLPRQWLLSELNKRFENYLGDLEITTPVNIFPLLLYYVKNYYSERSVLLGNSAHNIHPIAGQGLNLAIMDIKELTDKIYKHQQLGLDIGSNSMLEEYQDRRYKDNMSMITITHGFNWLFSNDSFYLRWPRRLGMAAVNRSDKLKKFFMTYAMGER